MSTFARCSKTEPKTCFDTSKNQILTGRLGDSLIRLTTSDETASRPRAPCTRRAKFPSRLHSPPSSSLSMGLVCAEIGSAGFAGAAEGTTGGASLLSAFTVLSEAAGGDSLAGSSVCEGSASTPSMPRSSVSKTTSTVRRPPCAHVSAATYSTSSPRESWGGCCSRKPGWGEWSASVPPLCTCPAVLAPIRQ